MAGLVVGILALGLVNFCFKALGPVLLAEREVPEHVSAAIDGMGQGLLAALVVQVLVGTRGSAFDPTLMPGVAVAMVMSRAKQHDLLCVLAAVVVTALARQVW